MSEPQLSQSQVAATQYPPGGQGKPRRTWPLTTRLVAIVTALVILATLLIGTITIFALKDTMQNQLDTQLTTAITLTQNQGEQDFSLIDPGRGFIRLPGLSTGTLGIIAFNGQVVRAEMIDETGGYLVLSERTVNTLVSTRPDADPASVYLGSQLGYYRLAASELPSGANMVLGLPLKELNDTLRQQQAYVLMVAIIVSVLSALCGFMLVRWNLRPLKQVAEAANTISELKLDKGEVDLQIHLPEIDVSPRNEVGQVAHAFRLMLDNIRNAFRARQDSEQQVRDFVADASHELRTPLASIRGYAELTRLQDPNMNEEVRHSIERISSEADRMTSLVEDMLLLASLDAKRNIATDQVDLTRLMIDTLNDVQVAGPTHQWQLDISEDEVVVLGEEAKLHQMIANLLTNARIHTPEGTVVTASLGLDGGWALISIHDTGPGIPSEQQQKMFQRFMRGDGSRSRKTGSTGLGLAIVQAIAQAHGGQVELSSAPGNTLFRIAIPLAPHAH